MMTGSAPGIEQFYTFVNSGPVLSDTDVNAIFFQFLYAFYIMNYFMIQHNDNHFGNVLIQTLPEYVNMDITVGGRNINFKTKHVIKFFDWDRSYTPSIGPNSILNAHVDNGTYNSFVPNRDFSTFLCFLKKYKIFEGIMSEMIPATAYISQNTRKHEEFIGNISESLHEWIKENKHIIHTDYKGKTFILVPRDVIERTFSKSSKQLLYSALGFASTPPDSISGVFLQFEFVDNDIYLPKGFSCHPLVSSSDVVIVKFFEDEETFKKLCKGLDKGISPTVYSYNFQKSV
jgi:hypothetical protein